MTSGEKRIGVLIPPVNVTVEPELNRWAPPGVTVDAARMWRRRARLSPDDLREMLTRLDDDCERLAMAQPGVVLYACTSGSSLETGGYDRNLSERIARLSGAAASTTSTAVAAARAPSASGARPWSRPTRTRSTSVRWRSSPSWASSR
jgi:maleate isomerase